MPRSGYSLVRQDKDGIYIRRIRRTLRPIATAEYQYLADNVDERMQLALDLNAIICVRPDFSLLRKGQRADVHHSDRTDSLVRIRERYSHINEVWFAQPDFQQDGGNAN